MLEGEHCDCGGAFGAIEAGEEVVFGFVAHAALEGVEGWQAEEGVRLRTDETHLGRLPDRMMW